MADIVDLGWLSSSAAHTYKVYKPKKATKSNQIVSNIIGDDIYEQYIRKLNETYAKNERDLFYDLAEQLKEYVFQVNEIYTSASETAFQDIQCAIVTMSINIKGLDCLYEMLFKEIEDFITMRLIINSDRVKCVSDFVKILQENLFQYLDLPECEIPCCLYSLTADFYHNNLNSKLPLVIVFEDFDCFNLNLLSDLLILIHENLEKMPCLLICCQSTDILPLNLRLPSKATNHLAVSSFSFQSTHDFFTKLIEDICWDNDSSFKLGPKTISHLTDVYKLWDTSLIGAFRRVKFCVFEHFYNKRYAKLCCPTDELDNVIANLTDEDLISIRNLPSLEKINLPKEANAFKSMLREELIKFSDLFVGIQHELKFYHHLKELLYPKETFTYLMSTWITFLSSEKLSESEDCYFLGDTFLKLESDQIINLMDRLSKFEESGYSDIYKALNEHFKDFDSKIKTEPLAILESTENKATDPQKRTRASHGINSPRKPPTLDRFALANALKQKAAEQTTKIDKLKKWQQGFLDTLKKQLDKIANPLYAPFHEIFFFDDVSLVKQFSLPAVRTDILDALASPEKILNCKCCKDGIGPNTPDISITYSIYCDSLRVINLKKCYDIFKQLIAQPETTRASPRKRARKEPKKEDEKQILARFINSIMDLEYLGLLRAHPRKIDHVERLVWPVNVHTTTTDGSESDEQLSKNFNSISINNN